MKTILFGVVAASVSLLVGCGPTGLEGADSSTIVDVDFVGLLETVEFQEMLVTDGSGSVGGFDSDLRIGSGTMILDGGQRVEFDGQTRAGNLCPDLGLDSPPGDRCVVIGAYGPGSGSAAWFQASQTSQPQDSGAFEAGRVLDIDDHEVIISLAGGKSFALPLSEDASLEGCWDPGDLQGEVVQVPDADAHYAMVDGNDEVSTINCAYGD